MPCMWSGTIIIVTEAVAVHTTADYRQSIVQGAYTVATGGPKVARVTTAVLSRHHLQHP